MKMFQQSSSQVSIVAVAAWILSYLEIANAQTTTTAPTPSPSNDESGDTTMWIYVGGGIGVVVLILIGICVFCWCRRGNKDIHGGNGSPNRKYFGGKGRIPDFDPEQEMMFDGPFAKSNQVKSNPLRSSGMSSSSKQTDSGMRERKSTDFSNATSNKSFVNAKQTVGEKETENADPIPIVLDQGNGVLRIEATVGPDEELGLITKPRESVRGIVICEIEANSAAERWTVFGLGDVMLSINGKDVLNASHEAVKLALEVCGKEVVLEVLRSKSAHKAAIKRPGSIYNPRTKTFDDGPTTSSISSTDGNRAHNELFSQGTLSATPTATPTKDKNTDGTPKKLTRQITKTELTDDERSAPLPTEPLLNGSPKGLNPKTKGLKRQATKMNEDRVNEAEDYGLSRAQTGVIRNPAAVADTDPIPAIIIDEAPTTLTRILSNPSVDGCHPSLMGDIATPPATTTTTTPTPKSKAKDAPPPVPTDVAPQMAFDTSKLQPYDGGPVTGRTGDGKDGVALTGTEAAPPKRKRTRTIKKEAGKLLVRLKQLVDGIENPDDLPEYSVVKSSLIEEFGKEFFVAQEAYVMSWLTQIGMSKFDNTSSSDPVDRSMATISRRGGRTKSFSGGKMKEMFDKKQNERTASAWFKEITVSGKKRKRYCEMKGIEVNLLEKVRKALVVRDSITISSRTSIQRHGYELYIINPDDRITLQAESEDVCQDWYSQLRATYIEICEKIDLEAFQTEMDDAPAPSTLNPSQATMMAIGGLENSGGGGNNNNPVSTKQTKDKNSPEKEKKEDAKKEPVPAAPELTAEEKAEKRAKARAALAEKRAAAKLARAANYDSELNAILAWIDALDEDCC